MCDALPEAAAVVRDGSAGGSEGGLRKRRPKKRRLKSEVTLILGCAPYKPPAPSVQQLVDERECLRRELRYKEADKLRSQLRQLGITVNDAERAWRAVDGRAGVVARPPRL